MLIWVSALHCEAKPVIDYYRLRKSHDPAPFDLYLGDAMACVVSGTGKVASAAASAWCAARFAAAPSIAWLNLGIAGAGEHEVGSVFLLDQVIDADSDQRYYPTPPAQSSLRGSTCMTLSRPSQAYRDDCLFDMEASGFMHSTLRCSSAELIRSIKVVSDNRRQDTGRRPQAISDLIHREMPRIVDEAARLAATDDEIGALAVEPDSWRRLLEMAHFSRTQQNRLRTLWRYLQLRNHDPADLFAQLAACRSGKAIIEALETISQRDSERL